MVHYAIPTLEEMQECASKYVKYCHAWRIKPPKGLEDNTPYVEYMLKFGDYCLDQPIVALQVCELVVKIDPDGYGAEQIAFGQLGTTLNSLLRFVELQPEAISFVRKSAPLQSILHNVWLNGLEPQAQVMLGKMKVMH